MFQISDFEPETDSNCSIVVVGGVGVGIVQFSAQIELARRVLGVGPCDWP